MSMTIQGFVMLDTEVAALNNAGADRTAHFENASATKKILKNGKQHVYVSGQALRRWWRDTLQQDFSWQMSPLVRSKKKKVVYTSVDPVTYPDDDLFGYMRADKEDASLTRVAPLKNSALISVSPTAVVQHWSSMSRQEGDAVPYAKDEYCAVLKGMFSIDIDQAGTFCDFERTGFKNLNEALTKKVIEAGGAAVDDPFAKDKDGNPRQRYRLDKATRVKRLQDVVKALGVLHGGAKLTTNYADVTPKLIVLAAFTHGNHPFSHLAVDDKGQPKFSIAALKEIYSDYRDCFHGSIYIGRRQGFMDELQEDLQELEKEHFVYGSVRQTIDQFAKSIEGLVE